MRKYKKVNINPILIKIGNYLRIYLSEKWLKFFLFPVFILYILFIITPTPLWVQFLSFLVIFFLALIFIKNRKESIKVFIILIGVFVSLRYFYWRTFNTINLDDGIFDAAASVILYLAELYSIIILLLGSFMSLRLLERNHINLEKEEDFLTVDVFIPTYNEPVEIIKTTALAAISMDYPQDKFNVYILDDGGTTQKLNDPNPAKREANRQRSQALKDFVNEVGRNLHYLTRERNLHAKAGNVNEALNKTNGDLILILDCDHVPAKDFLKRTVGFFNKYPKLFLLQTPHSFYNPDPLEKNLGIFKVVPSEADMFYKYIQKGLDFWGASFFCGSAAVLRKKYLQEVGGIQGTTITEDAETALELHSLGYDSAYYSRPMVYGLQPETFSAFIVQRTRWAQGMIQIFLLRNPLLKKGLKWYQKLGYLNANVFWFFGFARFVFLIAPILYPMLGVQIYNANMQEAASYAIPHFIMSIVLSYYLYVKVRWNFFSEIYEAIQSIFILPAIISVILKPRDPTFEVTPKGENLEEEFLSPFYRPVYLLFNLIVISFFFSFYRWVNYPDERGIILVILFWQIFDLFILGIGISVLRERPQRRRAFRIPAKDDVIVYTKSKVFSGKVRDISLTGIWIETDQDITDYLSEVRDHLIEFVIMDVRGLPFVLKGRVVNANSKNIRAQFEANTLEDNRKLAEVVYADSGRWEIFREEREMNPIQTTIFITKIFTENFTKAYKMATAEFINELKGLAQKFEIKGLAQKFILKLNKKLLRRKLN